MVEVNGARVTVCRRGGSPQRRSAGRWIKWVWCHASLAAVGWTAAGLLAATPAAPPRRGSLEIRVVEAQTNQPLAVNMFLRNARGQVQKPPGQPFWKDHFAFRHQITLELRPGRYTFEIERGPEYQVRTGEFEIEPGAADSTEVELARFVDMKREGWWSGDLHVHRPPADIPLLMEAQDLHIAPVITWWNQTSAWRDQPLPDPALVQFDGNRFYHLLSGEDERAGGALLYFNLPRPLPLSAGAGTEYPPMSHFVELARAEPQAHIEIEKPFWWDVPVWIALGVTDSIGLAHNHLWRSGVLDNEAWGRPRDRVRYPGPRGTGYWSQDIYYHLLNCGVRIAPSAGSASGVLDNPVGYNRVYVHCGESLTWDAWWEGLRAGRVVVTNGPLLRPTVNGELPGHVFRAQPGEVLALSMRLNLALRDRVDYLEVVRDGQVIQEVRLDEYRDRRGELPPVTFEESGWLLVRAVTANPDTFRFASSGPYYVEIGGRPRVSRQSAQFFLDWMDERIAKLQLDDPQQQADVRTYLDRARLFWQQKVADATAP
ncbi:MAG: CehA/McbA family metallohydrolase [Pirellulaceae bacterium]|jgi:hypothetical protein|nr:CehA/McbA family metallohydrolase [Pirellulaceae bacterium]